MSKFRFLQGGFSVMEMVAMVGIGSAVTVGVMRMTESQTKSQNSIKKNFAITSLNEEIKAVLSKEVNCTNTFRGLPPNGSSAAPSTVIPSTVIPSDSGRRTPTPTIPPRSSLTALKKKVNGSFVDVFPINKPDNDGIMIKGYSLSNTGLSGPETNLRIDFSRGKSALKDEAHKYITIRYSLDASGNIQSCYGTANNSVYWTRATAEPKNVFYETGNVGIGTDDPKVALDVKGDMKVGPEGICSAEAIGSIAYDATTQAIKTCTSTGWNSPSGAATLSTYTATCNSTSLVTTTTPLGVHKICLLKRYYFSNMGKDDHFIGDCIIEQTVPGTWSMRARCDESRTICEATCKD